MGGKQVKRINNTQDNTMTFIHPKVNFIFSTCTPRYIAFYFDVCSSCILTSYHTEGIFSRGAVLVAIVTLVRVFSTCVLFTC